MTRAAPVLFAVLSLAACTSEPVTPSIVLGTWGGTNAGLIVNDSGAHVHIGCTLGDVNGPIPVDSSGRFEVAGLYNINAFPIDLGVVHPALFRGQIFGNAMMLTVQLTDTAVTLGPVALTYGTAPQMGPCPICHSPGDMLGTGVEP
jgi:hypothetical protein